MLGQLTHKTRTLVTVAQTQQLPFLAAAIAYYAFLSVVPLLIVVLAIATALAGPAMAQELVTVLDEFLTPEAATLIEQALVGTAGRGGITFAGLVVLLWGALRIFRGLDIAFSRVYGNPRIKSLPEQLRDAMLVFLGVTLAIALTALISSVLVISPIPFVSVLAPAGLLVALPLAFFPLYYVFPARDVTVREAIPGAIFAGFGWAALGTVFGIYTANAGAFQLYGVLGGVLLLLVWFYFGGLILVSGAALNAVLSGRFEDRQLQQGGLRENRQRGIMSEREGPTDEDDGEPADERPDDTDRQESVDAVTRDELEDTVTKEELEELRERIETFEEEIEGRTVHREEIESDLKRYVRNRVRRGHAHGWGPYLVLLYGTIMTLGAFYFLSGGWAVLAMIIVWLSTLGLYTLMVIVGVTVTAAGVPGKLLERVRDFRR